MLQTRSIVDREGKTHVVLADSPQLRNFLVDVRENLVALRGNLTQAIGQPSNFTVTPTALSNLIQFSRSSDADFYEVLWNSVPTLATAQVTTIGNTGQWQDYIGKAGVTRYYWVRSRKHTGGKSLEVGPISATTLGSTAGVTVPVAPPAAHILILDSETGRTIPYILDKRSKQ